MSSSASRLPTTARSTSSRIAARPVAELARAPSEALDRVDRRRRCGGAGARARCGRRAPARSGRSELPRLLAEQRAGARRAGARSSTSCFAASRAAAASRRSGSSRVCRCSGVGAAERELALDPDELRRARRAASGRDASARSKLGRRPEPRLVAAREPGQMQRGRSRTARARTQARIVASSRPGARRGRRRARRSRPRPAAAGGGRGSRRHRRRAAQLVAHGDERVDRLVPHRRLRIMLAELRPLEEIRQARDRRRRSRRGSASARSRYSSGASAGCPRRSRRRREPAPCGRTRR